MSQQCAKCLGWLRDDISDNGVNTFRCDACGWECPTVMLNEGLMGAYPKEWAEEWAYQQYAMKDCYLAHFEMKPEDAPNCSTFVPCENMKKEVEWDVWHRRGKRFGIADFYSKQARDVSKITKRKGSKRKRGVARKHR